MNQKITKRFKLLLIYGVQFLLLQSLMVCITFSQPGVSSLKGSPTIDKPDKLSATNSPQKRLSHKGTPTGLFIYNKWIDLNENQKAERNEFFGLGKQTFFREEALRATLYDPLITKDTTLKIRIWDSTGNLIKTISHKYRAGRLFTLSNIEQILPPGDYILTINPKDSYTTYKVNFTLKGETPETSISKLSPDILNEGLYLVSKWEDNDSNREFDSGEITPIEGNSFIPDDVEFALALKLNNPDQRVVFQTWDTLGNLLGMTISNADSPHYHILSQDTTNSPPPNFLKPLTEVRKGTFRIMAILNNNNLTHYEQTIHIRENNKIEKDQTYPSTVNIPQKITTTLLSPNEKPNLEGFFLYSDYNDLNRDSIQQEFEFISFRHTSFNSRIENILAHFNIPQYQNQDITLQILDEYGDIIIEHISHFQNRPIIFEISDTEFRLVPGHYTILILSEELDELFETRMSVR